MINTEFSPKKYRNFDFLTDLAHSVEVVVAFVMRAEVFAGVAKARVAAESVTRVGDVPSRGASLIQGLRKRALN